MTFPPIAYKAAVIALSVQYVLVPEMAFAHDQDLVSGTWGEGEVDRYISANCPKLFDAARADPFAVPPPQVAPATSIALSYALERDEDSAARSVNRSFTWSYDPETHDLSLKAAPSLLAITMRMDVPESMRSRSSPLELHAAFPTHGELRPRADEIRSNAFGARVTVRRASFVERGIGSLGPFGQRQFPQATPAGQYKSSITMPPEEARTFVTRIRFEVEAMPMEWRPGAWLVHGFGIKRATFDDPSEQTYDGCYLNVIVTAVRFRDVSTGTVIQEWDTLKPALAD